MTNEPTEGFEIVEYYEQGHNLKSTSERFGLSIPRLKELLKSKGVKLRKSSEFLPTPELIQELCEQIRSKWSPEDRRLRSGGGFGGLVRWTPMQYCIQKKSSRLVIEYLGRKL